MHDLLLLSAYDTGLDLNRRVARLAVGGVLPAQPGLGDRVFWPLTHLPKLTVPPSPAPSPSPARSSGHWQQDEPTPHPCPARRSRETPGEIRPIRP